MKREISKSKILIALSGGIDSAVSVLELQKKGFEVIGIHFKMLPRLGESGLEDAQNVAGQLKIELKVKDISQDFKKEVLDNFIKEYQSGRTPNPCTLCNKKIKFKYLLEVADELGIKLVATGHYAGITKKDRNFYISRAKDVKKDQSYFLYKLKQKELTRIIFPLCDFTKSEVKEKAIEFGLKISSKESQDVCFMKKDETLKDFLSPQISCVSGEIVTEDKGTLGRHEGLAFYTIGQRRGLSINGGPFYVAAKNINSNTIIVTKNKDNLKLNPHTVFFENSSWAGDSPSEGIEYLVKTRYLAKESKARIIKLKQDMYIAHLVDSQWAVTPGQSLVVFDGELVVGGGIITDVK
ncbi:tRNA 2-thiouridine(34) synthase MnmA [bacterium]|nr:tRNA 2-thiouridine(34) synthase MnmA [bacterium]MBT4251455.1 tRNA 2-thiouridine(34) synthase MnmA [bacterium]MBT4597429.1 tRNA 2-thiouridine(34) synthase MnmA [bacterium]MBT6754268.1 tRNA 2-thiouridine(34) synthase MnmA [bacterium]MBT7037594.1 tRNA 2-thiouridine(34) synthase MnmA [bacterium]